MSVDTEDQLTNVKSLVLPEARLMSESPPFDLVRDLSQADWDLIYQGADNILDPPLRDFSMDKITHIRAMAFIVPGYFPQNMNDEVWEAMVDFLPVGAETSSGSRAFNILQIATAMRLSSPERAKKRVLIHFEDWERLENSVISSGNIGKVFERTALMYLFAPEKRNDPLIFDNDWNRARRHVRELKELRQYYKIANFLESAKIVDHQKVPTLEVDQETWDKVWEVQQASLEELRGLPRSGFMRAEFARLVARMAILAAKEVKVTETGVELVFEEPKEDFKKEVPVPQTKKY